MARFTALVALAAAAAFVGALTTPLAARDGHAALAARLAARAPAPAPEPEAAPAVQETARRRLSRRNRCPAKQSSSAKATAAATSSKAKSTTNAAPVNVAPNPTVASSPSKAAPPPASKPAQTQAPAPPPATPAAPAGAPAASGLNGNSCGKQSTLSTMTGDGTYFGVGLGACGFTNSDTDLIAAVSEDLYDTFPGYAGVGTNPNNNPICGKKVEAMFGGKSVVVTIVDRCTACACGSLDFSPAAFNQLEDPAVGRFHGLTWKFID